MKSLALSLTLLVSMTFCITIQAEESAPINSPIPFSEKETAQLRTGKPLLKLAEMSPFKAHSDNPWIAAILLRQDDRAAAGLLMDFQRHPTIFPKLKDITIRPLGESRYRIKSLVKAGLFQFQFTTLWEYLPQEQLVTFRLDREEKNDFEEYKGFWKFVAQEDNATLVLYSIRTKTGDHPLAFLEESQSRKEMLKTLKEFQEAL